MIKSLEIKNFQSHKHTKLKFSKGVNVIVGGSDNGKSAILKALFWLITNRPVGDSFRSHWGGDTVVNIKTFEGDTVSRSKSPQNLYEVNDTPLTAFRTDVPDEVKEVLNIKESNIQKQLDGHFLLSSTSGEVASFLNDIANLKIIDTTTNNLKKALTESNQSIKTLKSQIEEKEEEFKQYSYLDMFEVELEDLEDLEKKKVTIVNTLNRLEKIVEDVEEIDEGIKESEKFTEGETLVNETLSLISDKNELQSKISKLKNLRSEIKEVKAEIAENEQILGTEEIVTELLKLKGEEKAISSHLKALNTLQGEIHYITEKITREQEKAIKLEKMFHKYMPDVCPLCDTKLK